MSKVEKAKEQYRLTERILSYLPGYRGYKEKEVRRETDRLVRMHAAAKLKDALDSVRESLSSRPVREKDRELADRVMMRLDTVRQKTGRAVAGYAGLFDIVKVKEDRLDQLVAHDEGLLAKSEEIGQQSSSLSRLSSPEEIVQRLTQILEATNEFDGLLDRRNRIIKEL